MKFGSVCSGIEAASVAWKPLGWEPEWFAEIEPFPSAVLKHHYPQVPNLGDMTALPERILSGEIEAPEVFCGGTPCQAFSVAGNRESLADARGNLTLTFCEIANAIDTIRAQRGMQLCIIFWENVPGVLNTKDNAFGCFLGALAGEDCALEPPGGRWTDAGCVLGPERAIAWRTLDAQFFGLAQRRRRVFVVASARNGFDPAAVLFEFDGVRRDSAPRREAGKVAPTIHSRSIAGGGGLGTDFDCDGGTICVATGQAGAEIGADMAPTLTCNHEAPIAAYSIRTANTSSNGWGVNTEGVAYTLDGAQQAVAFAENSRHEIRLEGGDGSRTGALSTGGGKPGQGTPMVAVAVALRGRDGGATAEVGDDCAFALRASTGGGDKPHAIAGIAVRRLTPRECERLMGFPDDYTAIPWRGKPADQCPDGPRYRALGNSWAVPVVAWIGRRIAAEVAP